MAALLGRLNGASHRPSIRPRHIGRDRDVTIAEHTALCSASGRTRAPVTRSRPLWITLPTEAPARTVVTYDGSVARCGGEAKAGAAAILWGQSATTGRANP